jgi:hypothetical protein
MLKLSIAALVAFTVATAACVSSGSTSSVPSTSQLPTTSVGSVPIEPILGTWRMKYTCEAFVRAYTRYGIPDQLATGAMNALAAFGGHESSGDQTAPKICEDAKQYRRTHYFRPNGYLINYQGKQIVDDCHCYQLLDDHTFVSLGGPGDAIDPTDVSLRYTVEDDRLTFHVVVPDPCTTMKCRSGVAFAVYQYALGPWHRVTSTYIP